MALVDNAWYVDYGDGATTGYYAATKWANVTAVAGQIIRQFTAPAVGSERCFVCTTAGATGATEPTWVNTRGALNTSSSAVYQECTGIAALNGDATNTPSWTITATPPGGVKGTAVTLGQVIKRDSGASYQICTIAGTAGSGAEPAFSNTAGTTTADNTVTWTSLGVVGNFTGWQAPHARVASAFVATWGQAGNSFFVASEHAETQSTAIALTSPGTSTSPCIIDCTAKTPVPPTAATTGATISTTGASNITASGSGANYSYWNGITFQSGSAGNAANIIWGAAGPGYTRFKSCGFTLNNTSASSRFNIANGGNGLKFIFDTCTFTFGSNTSQTFSSNAGMEDVHILGGSMAVGANIPTTVFSSLPPNLLIQGTDLSAFASGITLIGANTVSGRTTFVDCKLGASVTIAATPTSLQQITDLIRGDSSGTNYRHERYHFTGTQTVDTTIIRTGGATDGTTVLSWKVVATANSKWTVPFECIPITFWNDSTSAITTLTIYGTTTGGGVPNDDDIWADVVYLVDAGDALGGFKTTTKASNLVASGATNNTSDSSTWAGGGAGNGFKITVPSFTPAQKGPITINLKIAKASATYYIDPKPSISGVTVSKSFIAGPTLYANELSGGGASAMAYRNPMRGNLG